MIRIHQSGYEPLLPEMFLFPGGEPHVVVEPRNLRDSRVWIEAHIGNMVDFGYLMATVNAVSRCKPKRLGLYIPYFPGARQDHPEPGTPFTLQVYADIVNTMGAHAVVVADPHSNVMPALVRCTTIEPKDILWMVDKITKYNGVICPDSGAGKRAQAVATLLNVPLYTAGKVRDQKTGKLSGFWVDKLPAQGRYLVVDDICDGGATFVGLADAVYQQGAYILDLYVTHGIFSKGYDTLLTKYERIITTDSYPTLGDRPAAVTVLGITPIAKAIMGRELL